jgi:hypothetical protein
MRDFSPIVGIASRVVVHGRHDTQVSSTIAPQLVGHEAPEVPRVLRSEFPTPLPNALVGDDDPPLRQELFDVTEAQTESVIQPNGVTDDLWWESVSVVAVRFAVHLRSLGGTGSS